MVATKISKAGHVIYFDSVINNWASPRLQNLEQGNALKPMPAQTFQLNLTVAGKSEIPALEVYSESATEVYEAGVSRAGQCFLKKTNKETGRWHLYIVYRTKDINVVKAAYTA